MAEEGDCDDEAGHEDASLPPPPHQYGRTQPLMTPVSHRGRANDPALMHARRGNAPLRSDDTGALPSLLMFSSDAFRTHDAEELPDHAVFEDEFGHHSFQPDDPSL